MRSLELLGHRLFKVANQEIKGRSFIAIDPESNTVYIAHVDNNSHVIVSANNSVPGDPNTFVQIGSCLTQGIVNFTYVTDLQSACLSTYDGDIILFNKERFEKGEEAVCNRRIDMYSECLILISFV
jgi:elongator complex protein 1